METKIGVVDQERVDALCKFIETKYDVPFHEEEIEATLKELELLIGSEARSKTQNLRRLLSQRRIKDLRAWKTEIYRNTQALGNIAHGRNEGAKYLAEEERRRKAE
jgi:hypothetical protein